GEDCVHGGSAGRGGPCGHAQRCGAPGGRDISEHSHLVARADEHGVDGPTLDPASCVCTEGSSSLMRVDGGGTARKLRCAAHLERQLCDMQLQMLNGRYWPILLKNSVVEVRTIQASGSGRRSCKQAFQVRAPLRVMRESDFPFPVLSAPTTSPFFAGFARWLPSGTHRGHRPDHAIAIAVAAGCASGARTASRPSCAAAEIARSPGSWQFVWPQRVPPR